MTDEYFATIIWNSDHANFLRGKYSRAHAWIFDGGIEIQASSSPHVVPIPFSNPNAVDPEEAFIASISSCHMLWFLSIAAKNGFEVLEYIDEASGVMGKNAEGKVAMISVSLKPKTRFSGVNSPSLHMVEEMHEKAHAECFIANSVKTEISCYPEILY